MSSSPSPYAGANAGGNGERAEEERLRFLALNDVTSVPGLVSLVIGWMKKGASDEAAILQRHLRSPDFGNPLLTLVTPSSTDPDYPHIPGDEVGIVTYIPCVLEGDCGD